MGQVDPEVTPPPMATQISQQMYTDLKDDQKSAEKRGIPRRISLPVSNRAPLLIEHPTSFSFANWVSYYLVHYYSLSYFF